MQSQLLLNPSTSLITDDAIGYRNVHSAVQKDEPKARSLRIQWKDRSSWKWRLWVRLTVSLWFYHRTVFIATDKQTGEKVAIKKHKQKDQDEFGVGIVEEIHNSSWSPLCVNVKSSSVWIILILSWWRTSLWQIVWSTEWMQGVVSDNRKDYPDLYMVMEYISFVSRCYGSLMSRVITICFIWFTERRWSLIRRRWSASCSKSSMVSNTSMTRKCSIETSRVVSLSLFHA